MEAEPKFRKHVGEYIVTLLDRFDDIQKPGFLAKAFIAFCRGRITIVQLQRLNHAIDRVLTCDLAQLQKFALDDADAKFEIDVEQNFLNSGLGYMQSGYGVGGVHPTELCRLFIDHIL